MSTTTPTKPIAVDSNQAVAESHALVDRVNAALADHIPAFGNATVHVCPGAERSGEGSVTMV